MTHSLGMGLAEAESDCYTASGWALCSRRDIRASTSRTRRTCLMHHAGSTSMALRNRLGGQAPRCATTGEDTMPTRREFFHNVAGTLAGLVFVGCGLLEVAEAQPQS